MGTVSVAVFISTTRTPEFRKTLAGLVHDGSVCATRFLTASPSRRGAPKIEAAAQDFGNSQSQARLASPPPCAMAPGDRQAQAH
jgi:hypothetical protein